MVKLGKKGIGTRAVWCLAVFIAIAYFGISGVLASQPRPASPLTYGTLYFAVTDRPNAIGDFTSLTVSVSKISIHSASDNLENTWLDFTPSIDNFDLVSLESGDIQILVSTPLQTGRYTQVRLVVTSAVGILKTGGTENVTVPSGELKLVQSFQIEENKTTTFVFDLNVVKTGNNAYMLSPVAGKVTIE